jgi:hypothetical protein
MAMLSQPMAWPSLARTVFGIGDPAAVSPAPTPERFTDKWSGMEVVAQHARPDGAPRALPRNPAGAFATAGATENTP